VEQAIQNTSMPPIKNELKQPKISVTHEKDPEKGATAETPIQHLIIDCSGFTFIDLTSATALADVIFGLNSSNMYIFRLSTKWN
jgi:hypothetical protein